MQVPGLLMVFPYMTAKGSRDQSIKFPDQNDLTERISLRAWQRKKLLIKIAEKTIGYSLAQGLLGVMRNFSVLPEQAH